MKKDEGGGERIIKENEAEIEVEDWGARHLYLAEQTSYQQFT